MTIRQIVSWLVQNPVWCVVIGMGIGLLLIVTLIAGFTFEEKLNGGQPESENSVANQIARGLQRDLNGPPWWWRW